MDIPEDDPRNPAVIADNVGDNVGDVRPVWELICSSPLRARSLPLSHLPMAILLWSCFLFWIAGAGVFSSFLGYFAVGAKDGATAPVRPSQRRDCFVCFRSGIQRHHHALSLCWS
jgi:K(+)-stimulated pyrophosphate-energized sodium pump